MVSRDFLNNAKLFGNGINSNRIWLVDCDKKIATFCDTEVIFTRNFTDLEEPTSERYADFLVLIHREIDFLGVDEDQNIYSTATKPQYAALANQAAIQVAIQQALALAAPQLASLIAINEEKWDYSASAKSAIPREELIDLALAYAKRLMVKAIEDRGTL